MASVNKWHGIGNITKDPDVRYAPGGDAITNITVACNEQWKGKDGEKKESVEFVRVAFFGKLAELVGQYLKKGSMVYIEGKLRTRKWQDKDGQDRYTTEINADVMRMLGGRDANAKEAREPAKQAAPAGGLADMDDEIPF